MQYDDLQNLIDHEDGCRAFFSALPLGLQLTLQRHDALIHSDQDLRQYADFFGRLQKRDGR